MPEVSVIIPVYNNEKFIEKCIRSVMEQSFCDLEILVVNDGSTDGSAEILQKLAGEDGRIRLVSQSNQGVAAARNCGLDMASGKYLTFVDGDDYIGKDYIEKLYDFSEKNHTEMLICGITYVEEKGKILRKIVPGTYRRFERGVDLPHFRSMLSLLPPQLMGEASGALPAGRAGGGHANFLVF